MVLWLFALLVGAALLAAIPFAWAGEPSPANLEATDRYIVVLNNDVDAADAAHDMANVHGLGLGHVYEHALKGFSAHIPAARLDRLRLDSRIASITPDQVVSVEHCIEGNPRHDAHCTTTTTSTTTTTTTTAAPGGGSQVVPTGIARIGAEASSTISGNGSGIVDVDVAVIDTGIDTDHADLNVVGGYNCSRGRANKFDDGHGHGTHVAGTIGAIDNNSGVVGVAPGARLWAVRVLNNSGFGFTSDIVCGIDWVAQNADTIDVANMSLGGAGSDGPCSSDPQHEAICNAVNAGVTFVVAAGNDSDDAANHRPAAFDEVITVSALADFDGKSGGSGSATCRSDTDDTFADFSNFGTDVDLIAPGVCILSTWNDGGTHTISGTSMASPHVAGAAALYKAANSGATPSQVKAALQNAGNMLWDNSDDPDSTKEPLLDVSAF
jgi:subtilisin family serine protease